jgi:hypothetical protein
MNIEHRTSNVQHRIMYSARRVLLCRTVKLKKKTEQAYSAEKATKARSESSLRDSTRLPSMGSGPEHVEGSSSQAVVQYSAVFRSRLQRDSLVLKSIKRSVIDIGRSMLDVRCSTFNLFTVPARRSFIRGLQSDLPCQFVQGLAGQAV